MKKNKTFIVQALKIILASQARNNQKARRRKILVHLSFDKQKI
jgi:hypothetical protein